MTLLCQIKVPKLGVKTAIYDVSGNLVSFSLLDRSDELVGFVDRFPQSMFQVSSLKNGDEISRKSLISTATVNKLELNFGAPIPKREEVHHVVVDGFRAIETFVFFCLGKFAFRTLTCRVLHNCAPPMQSWGVWQISMHSRSYAIDVLSLRLPI